MTVRVDRAWRPGHRRLAGSLLAALGLVACGRADPQGSCASAPGGGLVRLDPSARFVDGAAQPFEPRGIGSYPLLDHAGWGRLDAVRAIYDRALGLARPLVRTGAYLTGGSNPGRLRDSDGTIREEGLAALDRVVLEAQARGVRLVLVLANHWQDYGGAPATLAAVAPGEALPVSAFYTDERAIADQERYVAVIVGRVSSLDGRPYATNETIFAWELVNEPRCDGCDPGALVAWSSRMSRAVRAAGAIQLVAWGGVGYAGAHGEDFDRLAREGGLDVMTLHLYPDIAGGLSLGGDGDAAHSLWAALEAGADTIRDRARRARAAGVPLLLEEAGWRGTDEGRRDPERALVLGAWLAAAHEEGVGVLPWMIAEPDRPDYDGYLIDVARDPRTVEVLGCD